MPPRNPRQGPIPSDMGWLVDELASLSARLDTLEAPSGESLTNTVAKLTALIEDIQSQLDAWTASRWTNAQIQTEIDNKIAAMLAGSPTIGGNLTVTGNLTASGQVRFPNVPATTFVVEPRAVVWVDTSNGRLGRT